MQHVAALLHLQRLRQDPRQLGNAFARVAQLLADSDSVRVPGAASRGASEEPGGASASDTLQGLEQPLREAVSSMGTRDTLDVLSAWARAHAYAPPSDLAALVAARLQRLLAAAPAAAPKARRADLLQRTAATTLGTVSSSSSGGNSATEPANPPSTPSSHQPPGAARTWQEAFVPKTAMYFRQAEGSSRSASGTSLTAADTGRLAAVTAALSALSHIAGRGPEQARVANAALEGMAPTALSLLHAELRLSQRGGGKVQGTPDASAAAERVLTLLQATSHLPQTRTLQSSLQQPLLRLVQSMVPAFDAPQLLRVLDALGDMEACSRQQAKAAASMSGLEGARQQQSGVGTAGRRRHFRGFVSWDDRGPTDTLLAVLAVATQRLAELAPQLSPDQVAAAATALGRVCGSHHKFAGDGFLSAVPLMAPPLAAMADAIVARPASLPVAHAAAATIAAGYARLMASNTLLFHRLAADVLAVGLEATTPAAVAALAYAFAATNTPHPHLMGEIVAYARPRLGGFSQLQLCNLLWACAVLGHDDPQLLGAAQRLVAAWPLHQLHWSLLLQLLQVHNLYALLHDPSAVGSLHKAGGGSSGSSSCSGSGGGDMGGIGGGSASSSSSSSSSSGGGGGGGSGNVTALHAPLFALPESALPGVRHIVARERDPPRISKLHQAVLRVLRKELRLPARVEVPILQGTASVDTLVVYRGRLVAVESDGPWHYTRASPQRHNGKSVLRDRTLAAAGLVPISLSARNWSRMSANRRPGFLRAALDDAVAAHGGRAA